MIDITLEELNRVQLEARTQLNEFPQQGRLPGAYRDLSEGEKLAYAYYQAAILMLNGKGALKDDYVRKNSSQLMTPDSETSAEDHDYEDAEEEA